MRIRPPMFDLSAFTRGMLLPLRGFRFLLVTRGLKRYAVLPLIFNIILYGLAIGVFFYFVVRWDVYNVAWDFWGPVGRYLAAAINWMGWLVKLVVIVLGLGAAFFTFTGVGMALASPLNDILSEKVEMAHLGTDIKPGMPFRFTVRAGVLSFWDSLNNLARQLFYTVLMLPFLLVPLIGFLPLFLVGAYFAGFGFLDSAMARNFLRPPHKKLLVRKHYWEVVGFGAAMQICFAIPGLGMLLMPVGVVAGTLLYCGEDWETLLADGGLPKPEGFVPPKINAAEIGRLPVAPER